jgi:hypothetical protein
VNRTLKPLIFNPLPIFSPIGLGFNPRNLGLTNIPNPFSDIGVPGGVALIQLPFNFLNNISKFLFAPIPNTITEILKDSPRLSSYIASVGVSTQQNIATLATSPAKIPPPATEEDTPPGLFVVYSGNTKLSSYVTYDQNVGGLAQLIKTSPKQSLKVTLNPQSQGEIIANYLGNKVTFNQGEIMATSYIVTPDSAGRYIFKTDSSPIALLVEVIQPVIQEEKKENILTKIWKWFTQ